MKMLIVSGTYPPIIGGVATFVHQFAKEYSKKNKVEIYTFAQNAKSSNNIKVNIIKGRIPYFWQVLQAKKAAKEKIEEEKIDVLFVTDALMAHYARSLGVKVLFRIPGDFTWEYFFEKNWTQHNIDNFHKKAKGIKYFLLKRLVKSGFNSADKLITTPDLRKVITKHYGVDESKCVDILNTTPVVSVSRLKKFSEFTVLYVGRLIPLKGIEYLLRAVSKIKDVKLIICGYGPDKERLESIASELKIQNRVSFKGRVSHDQAIQLMKQSHVVVNAAVDGVGVSNELLESVHVQTPIITTNYDGVKSVVGGAIVHKIKPKSVDDIVKNILLLKNDNVTYLKTVKSYKNPPKITWPQVYNKYLKELESL